MRTTVALLSCLAQALRPRIVSRLSAKPERANVLRIGCKMRPGVWIQLADHFRPLAWSYSEKLTSFVLRAKVVVSRVLTFSNITYVRHAYPQKGLVDAGSWQSAAREVGLRGGDRAPAVIAVSASISAAPDAQVLPNSASGSRSTLRVTSRRAGAHHQQPAQGSTNKGRDQCRDATTKQTRRVRIV
jgi:hypothetical protein